MGKRPFQDEKFVIEQYRKTGTYDPRSQQIINNYLASQARAAQAQKTIKESGVKLASPGTLQRTSAQILGGSNVPLKQVSASVRRQVEIVRANQDLAAGRISVSQYKSRISSVESKSSAKEKEESETRLRTATAKAKSAAIKQSDARAAAAQSGSAAVRYQ